MVDSFDICRNQGSASVLTGDAGLAVVFVDDPGAAPWIAAERAIVEAQITEATRWLEAQARRHGAALRFRTRFMPTVTVDVQINEHDRAAGPHHSGWMNTAVSRLFGERVSVASAFAATAAAWGCSSFAVLFVVRRYSPSRAFPFSAGHPSEFACERAILFADEAAARPFLPSLVAHELLHLYGAIDLVPGKLEEQAGPADVAAIRARAEHGSDVMHTPTARPIDDYDASDLTAYLVGWLEAPPVWLRVRVAA